MRFGAKIVNLDNLARVKLHFELREITPQNSVSLRTLVFHSVYEECIVTWFKESDNASFATYFFK